MYELADMAGRSVNKMVDTEQDYPRSWWDLTSEEKLQFAKKVRDSNVHGWEALKQASWSFGFEPSKDMPTIFELCNMAKDGDV